MNILLSTGQKVGVAFIIIGGVIVLGGCLFLLYHFVISRNRVKHQIRELQKKYSYLDALLIGQDSQYIHRLEIISRTNLLYVDKHEKFSRRFKEIYEKAKEVQVDIISVSDVDKFNVYQSSKQGMLNCLKKAKSKIDFVLTDAMPLGDACDHEAIIKGDAKSASIAAASIIAKVTRDHLMYDYAKVYPEYHFEKHKGYVTKLHLEMIDKYGICEIHRKSFAPVQDIIRKHNQK